MYISAKDNQKVKAYCKLSTSKKARTEQGAFVVEGVINCLDILRTENIEITSLFYTEEALEKYRGKLPVEVFEHFDVKKRYIVSNEVAEKMSQVEQTSGAFVIAGRLDLPFSREMLDPKGRYLILNNVQDPGNLGTMIRTSAAVGIDGIVLSANTVDLYNPKVVRSAMASMPKVKLFIENDFSKVIGTFNEMGIKTCAAVVKDGESVTDFDWSDGCAVIIGNEGKGLSDNDASLCSHKVTIHMNGNIDSLNAAVASSIMLWEMCGRGK